MVNFAFKNKVIYLNNVWPRTEAKNRSDWKVFSHCECR